MKLKLISDGTERNTILMAVNEDGSTERVKGITAIRLSCEMGGAPSLEVSFIRVPFEIDHVTHRRGGEELGTVRYLCGCVRHYFAEKDRPASGEKCPYHGDVIQFERVNEKPEGLAHIAGGQ